MQRRIICRFENVERAEETAARIMSDINGINHIRIYYHGSREYNEKEPLTLIPNYSMETGILDIPTAESVVHGLNRSDYKQFAYPSQSNDMDGYIERNELSQSRDVMMVITTETENIDSLESMLINMGGRAIIKEMV